MFQRTPWYERGIAIAHDYMKWGSGSHSFIGKRLPRIMRLYKVASSMNSCRYALLLPWCSPFLVMDGWSNDFFSLVSVMGHRKCSWRFGIEREREKEREMYVRWDHESEAERVRDIRDFRKSELQFKWGREEESLRELDFRELGVRWGIERRQAWDESV